MEFLNIENNKINEPHKFVFNLPQGLGLKRLGKYAALQTCLFITYGKI